MDQNFRSMKRSFVLTSNEGYLNFYTGVENVYSFRVSSFKYTLQSSNNKYITIDLNEHNSSYLTHPDAHLSNSKYFCMIPVNFTTNTDVIYINGDQNSYDTNYINPVMIESLHYRIFMNGTMLPSVEISSSNPIMITFEFLYKK